MLVFPMLVENKKQASPRGRAVTKDIVGNPPPGNQRVPQRWKKHFRRLVELRDHLAARQGSRVNDVKAEQTVFSMHMADAATDSFDRDLALSRVSSEQDAVYEIGEALDRIRDGSFGVCELTGKPIEPARLEAIPWARFSLEAERTLEKNGAARRTRLAPREAVSREVNLDGETRDSAREEQIDHVES
jgi:RNA polymerase-binding transcription factor DksA